MKNLLVAALILIATSAFSTPKIIEEAERLRNSLSLRDPSRQGLTLRIADLYFNEATRLAGKPSPTAADRAALASAQRRAIQAYQDGLSGGNGTFDRPTGALKAKLEFQLARLYKNAGETPKAEKIWKELVGQSEFLDLKRESALRLAETYEESKNTQNLEAAARYYQTAVELSQSNDVTAYGHYRRGWILRKLGRYSEAVEEIKESLWDSKGQVREEALRDLLVFSAQTTTDPKKNLYYFEDLAGKLARPDLILRLAEGYYSAGNKVAGTLILGEVNAKKPALNHQLRLLEEYYGLRQWDNYRNVLEQVKAGAEKPDGLEGNHEKLLRRLTVQLDAERVTQTQLTADFSETLRLYLKLFPSSPEKGKMADGLIATEKDAKGKIAVITGLLNDATLNWAAADQIKYLELRARLSGEDKDFTTVVADISKLMTLEKDKAKLRKYRFVLASAKIDLKATQEAFPVLKSIVAENAYDTLGTKSELFVLQILGDEKKYREVYDEGSQWAKGAAKVEAGLDKEVKEIKSLATKAHFEWAVGAGETKEALETFTGFCFKKEFLPKACENAKVLAIKIRDNEKLIALLKEANQETELAAQYEATGRFGEAAALYEKLELKEKADTKTYLKISLLYELAEKNADRDRLLNVLVKKLEAQSKLGDEASLIRLTLEETQGLQEKHLNLPWSKAERCEMTEEIAAKGALNASLEKNLLSCDETGKVWSKLVVSAIEKDAEKQAALHFYGKNGKRRFETRMAALKKLSEAGDAYMSKSGHETRTQIAELLSKNYQGLATEILESPIPKEVTDPADIKVIQDSLAEMAKPFNEKAKSYSDLALSERTKGLEVKPVTKAVVLSAPSEKLSAKEYLQSLKINPFDRATLTSIKSVYEKNGQRRLAAYFQGRLNQIGEVQP